MERLPESTVEYFLFPCLKEELGEGKEGVRQKLDDLVVQYSGHLARYLADYIWHKQPFSLRPIVNDSDCYIYGQTTFEDNIEDEYFILFLLRELTLFDSQLVVKINDEDGEILLIESAQYLDKWAQDPRRTGSRVFLCQGQVHLVSPGLLANCADADSRHFAKEAARFVVNNPEKTRCSDAIQKCITNRTDRYPANIKALYHRAHCQLPISVALLLQHNPKLISHAVRAYYFRTAEDHKTIVAMKHFSGQSCVLSSVKFTRCLYAQMTSQEMPKPDKRCAWPIPATDAPNYSACINGFKVTAGFEILLSQYENSSSKQCKREGDEDIEGRHLWSKFLACLEKNGYFANEPAGSKRYTERLQQGKLFFRSMFRGDVDTFDQTEEDVEAAVGHQVCEFTRNVDCEKELQRWRSLSIEEEDDDSWLYLDQADLDALLAEKFGCPPSSSGNVSLDDISKSIPETIKKFVFNERSGLKGAEAPKRERAVASTSTRDKVQFNENEFANFVKEIQFLVEKKPNLDNFKDGESSDSSSMGDYGSEDDDDEFEDHFGASPAGQSSSSADAESESAEIKAYLKKMDTELASTAMGLSFKKATQQLDSDDEVADDEASPTECSAEIDLNALSNILESYSGEAEMSTSVGPATALFATMGTKLPDIERNS